MMEGLIMEQDLIVVDMSCRTDWLTYRVAITQNGIDYGGGLQGRILSAVTLLVVRCTRGCTPVRSCWLAVG